MNTKSPESRGLSSKYILEYLKLLESNRLSTHNVLIARGDDMLFEKYWAPFDKDFKHRLYSVSKSFVSLAVGFALDDGLLSLDDPISKHFPVESAIQEDENQRNQTIRDMLMMATAKLDPGWFEARTDDRVRLYFENKNPDSRPGGTIYNYDSFGSFVLCAMVERLTGKNFMDYLREKFLDKIGVSKDTYCMKCPGGHSWGDSAIMCRPMDLLKVARFVLNKGKHNGVQLLSEEYITEATSKQIDNNPCGYDSHKTCGYGYQFWRTRQNSFYFNGMGDQYAICVPDKDIILVYNANNMDHLYSKKVVIDGFFDIIVDNLKDGPVEENREEIEKLSVYTKDLKLASAIGKKESGFAKEVDGVTYILNKNPMGISKMRITFNDNGGVFEYTNAQGNKSLPFGMCENVFSPFPQEGYSDEVGSVATKGHFYRCAASAAWVEEKKLFIKVQIIDKYFGDLNIVLGFKGNLVGIEMNKVAEDFLEEYQGFAGGYAI